MAMDMGLYRCLPHLAKMGMGTGKTVSELEEERPLVIGARIWLGVRINPYRVVWACELTKE